MEDTIFFKFKAFPIKMNETQWKKIEVCRPNKEADQLRHRTNFYSSTFSTWSWFCILMTKKSSNLV